MRHSASGSADAHPRATCASRASTAPGDGLANSAHIFAPSASATVKMSLSPRPHRLSEDDLVLAIFARACARAAAIACAHSSAGMMPSVRQQQLERVERLDVGHALVVDAADLVQPAMLGADAGIVEPRRDRVRLGDLAVLVLQQIGAVAVEDAGAPAGRGWRHACRCRGRGPPPRRRASRRPRSSRNGWNSPIAFDPPPIAATSRSGRRPSASSICARASLPITHWKSRTSSG